MTQMIFVSLPVADVERSAAFYAALGFTPDPRFSQAGQSASFVVSDAITIMLLSHSHFSNLTPKAIGDARTTAQALFSLSRDSREAVDVMVEAAVAAGGKADVGGTHEEGDYMYGRDFEDLDGHGFGVMWMDVDAAMKAWSAAGTAAA